MNSIKNTFSIKDLENLSGIKAHTIRIWEKRYGLLSPERTDTNIRYYSLESLQKLLNITLLYHNDFKISKISGLNAEELQLACRNLVSEKSDQNRVINAFKLSMLNFDSYQFEKTFQELKDKENFSKIFESYFLPFLNEIGLLWQTDSIYPAHEHFISALIKQKIQVEIEKYQSIQSKGNPKFILFLPENEIHDLGLLYLNYILRSQGCDVIYLGTSLPMRSLELFLNEEDKLTFVCYSTVAPHNGKVKAYIDELFEKIITKCNSEFWFVGNKINELKENEIPEKMKKFENIFQIMEYIENSTVKQL